MKTQQQIEERINNFSYREKDGLIFTQEKKALEFCLNNSAKDIKDRLAKEIEEANYNWARILIWVME